MGLLKATYGGVEIPIKITRLDRNMGPPMANTTKIIGNVDGTELVYSRREGKTITIEFQNLNQTAKKLSEFRRKTAGIIGSKETKQLIFSDEPNLYYNAVLVDEATLSEEYLVSNGKISFYVPDGVAHATTEKSFTASENSEGILEAAVVNNGTEEVPVSYEITHNHENGFIGIVSEYGAIQLGKVDEVDTETRQKSEVLFKYQTPNEFINNFQGGQGIFDANHDYPKNGTWGQVELNGKKWMSLDTVGSGSSWHGAIMQKSIPEDSNGKAGAKNFHCQTVIWFETGKVPQTGAIEMVIGRGSDYHLASVHIVKSATGNNTASVVFQINGKEVGRVKYEPTYKSATAKGGILYIKKTGETFEFYFNGKKYSYRDSSMKDMEANSVSLSVMQYSNRGKGNLVTHMYFGEISFQKNNVEYEYDIPNRYPEDSVVYVDGNTTKVYVDGVPSQQDEVKGSDYFKVPPGETKIQFYYSDFSDPPPDVEVRIREAYL